MGNQTFRQFYISSLITGTYLTSLFSSNALAADDKKNRPLTNVKIYTQLDTSLSHRSAVHGVTTIYENNNRLLEKAEDMKDHDPSFTLKMGIKHIATRIRYEMAFTHYSKLSNLFSETIDQENTLDELTKIGSDALMFNIAYDYPVFNRLSIYPLFGVGVSINNFNGYLENVNQNYSESRHTRKISFAWQAGAGMTYNVYGNLIVDLSYKFVDLGKATLHYDTDELCFSTKSSLYSSNLSIGLRYTF